MTGNREYKSDVFAMLMEDRGISLTVHNDASFVLDMHLSVYEHQSSVCPNMPVRSLVYFSNILERMIKDRNIYGRRLVKIPTPHFAVFYNGQEEFIHLLPRLDQEGRGGEQKRVLTDADYRDKLFREYGIK